MPAFLRTLGLYDWDIAYADTNKLNVHLNKLMMLNNKLLYILQNKPYKPYNF